MGRSRMVVGVVVMVSVVALLAASDFESPPTLEASEVLPAAAVAGDHYRLDAAVSNDGYMNSYAIESDFGPFEAYGTSQLVMRLLEIGALGVLDDLTKTEVFANAVKEGATQSLRAIGTIATKPVQTVKGLPKGVGRLFGRTKRSVEAGYKTGKELVSGDDEDSDSDACEGEACEGTSEEDEGGSEEDEASRVDQAEEFATGYAKRYFGVNAAQRRWSQKLGVDPYTSNAVLTAAIQEIAKFDSAGRFAVRLAPIPRIPGSRTIAKVNSLVWTMDAYELVQFNKKRLAEAGVAPEVIDVFYLNAFYSPTAQTLLFTALLNLEAAADLGRALVQANSAESDAEARFFVTAAQMLQWFHLHESPVARLLPGERAFVVESEDGRIVLHAPVDYLSWTPEVAAAAGRISTASGGEDRREIWLLGDLSARCRAELESLGWGIETDVGARIFETLAPAAD